MIGLAQTAPNDPLIRAAGGFVVISGILGAFGILFLIALYVLAFGTPYKELGYTFGMLNDICVALQYLLTIPVALAMRRMLGPSNPGLIGIATAVGIAAMILVILLQLLLVFQVLTFQQQAVWVSLAILLGVGFWLVATGVVARDSGLFPRGVFMSAIAVPYFGFPAWAFWLGRRLLGF